MDKDLRNALRNTVTQCRKLLEEAVHSLLEGQYGIHASGLVEDASHMGHLTEEDRSYREDLLAHLAHIRAAGIKTTEAVAQLAREIAFTHLNRLVAFKMMEVRGLIRESVSGGLKSQGFLFYLADHAYDERLWSGGQQERAYRHFLRWLGARYGEEIPALFDPLDPANRAYPPQKVLDQVLDLLNSAEMASIWMEDETIGWVYQYFTPKEMREQARKESAAPRNSYELAFRNQFYTPRYVVEFLTDNTLGRIWYEMAQGRTSLAERCRYLVRRKHPVFLQAGEEPPAPFQGGEDWGDLDLPGEMWTRPNPDVQDMGDIWHYALTLGNYDPVREGLGRTCADIASACVKRYAETHKWEGSFEELRCSLFFAQRSYHHSGDDPEGADLVALRALHQAICERWDLEIEYILHRAPKDPRQIKMLDPAGGSGHFALYSFDLFQIIYVEAYDDPDLGVSLRQDYPDRDAFLRAVPGLILEHNLHLIDIDPRACQIAALALWLRAQRAYQEMGLRPDQRPRITRAHVVCAEPMPGDPQMLEEYLLSIDKRLRPLVRTIWEKMQLAGEAGSLLKIEQEIEEELTRARTEALADHGTVQMTLFQADQPPQQLALDLRATAEDQAFWARAEDELLAALRDYARRASNGQGLRRQLFAEDAERGLTFVDVCRQWDYDIVLMNPPFGESAAEAKDYVAVQFPRSKNDLYAAFIERWLVKLDGAGRLGAITSRLGFFNISFQHWREDVLLAEAKPLLLADLGYGVLDGATVETAAYVLERAG